MAGPVRVMLEQGKKKRVVACAFDWPGWDRSARIGTDVLAVLAAYRPRYAVVAEQAGFGAEFVAAAEFEVVERLDGIGMTDYFGISGKAATPEYDQMTGAERDRKIALLRACWHTFDDVAARVSPELRKGPRGGGWEKDRIIRHVSGVEIDDFAPKVGVRFPLETRDDAEAVGAYRDAFVAGIREHHAGGVPARSWALQFLIRLIENPCRRCGLVVAFRGPMGLAPDPPADRLRSGFRTTCQPVGSCRGVARKRRERSEL